MKTQTTSRGKSVSKKTAVEVEMKEERVEKTAAERAKELAASLTKAKAEAKEEAAKAKAEKAAVLAAKKEAAAKAKEEKKTREPDMVSQMDEHGNPELIDRNVFPYEISCSYPGCEEKRWVTKSGLLEATMCKPHARKSRRQRRLARIKQSTKDSKAIVEAALKLGLFPKSFMKQHGLV